MFSKLGEKWFDEYWMNYKKITTLNEKGIPKTISTLREYVEHKNGDTSLVVDKSNEDK